MRRRFLTRPFRKSSCTVKFTIQRALPARADNARHRSRRRCRFPDGLSPSPDAWPALYLQDLNRRVPRMKNSLIAAAPLAGPAFPNDAARSAAVEVPYNYVQGGYTANNGDSNVEDTG